MVCLGLIAASAAPASAVLMKLRSGQTISYLPLRQAQARTAAAATEAATNLDFNGGPVMPINIDHTFYWRPDAGPAYPSDYQSGIDRYFTDLAHDSGLPTNVDSVAAQLNDTFGRFASNTTVFGGAVNDTTPYPPNGCQNARICLTDQQIRDEVARYIVAHGLSTDVAHEYFVMTPPGVAVCFDAAGTSCSANAWPNVGYCAYHGYSTTTDPGFVYALIPYNTGNPSCDDGQHPNGTTSDGALQGLSHEHNESMTDPVPFAATAWLDYATGTNTGYENGDKCQRGSQYGTPLGTAPNGSPYNQVINGHPYLYQEEWSNQTHQCVQRLAFNPASAPLGYFSSTPVKGLTMRFNATGSTAPRGIARYAWQFNDNDPYLSQQSTTTRTVTHTFPGPGLFPVAMTAFAHDGTSIGTMRWVLVGAAGPTPGFTVTTLAPHAGTPVSFNGTGSKDPGGSIAQFVWTFGDGSPLAFGPTPSHTYPHADRYRVTLTIIDGSGQQASLTKLVSVK
jgi:PKD repeat protein